jgi:hypothetical protein
VHPIERLRYVARASGADQALLVDETARALGAFTSDPTGLVTACRRIVDRHPTSAPLWWLCARVLTAPDPNREAWAAVDEIARDPTPIELAHSLPDGGTVCVVGWPEQIGEALPRRGDVVVLAVDALGEGSGLVRRLMAVGMDALDVPTPGLGAAVAESDLVLIEALALGPGALLALSGSRAAAAVARHAGVPVWAVAGAGRILPERMWSALTGRLAARGREPWDLDEEIVPLDLVDCVAGPTGPVPPAAALLRTDCPIAPELLKSGSAPGTHEAP